VYNVVNLVQVEMRIEGFLLQDQVGYLEKEGCNQRDQFVFSFFVTTFHWLTNPKGVELAFNLQLLLENIYIILHNLSHLNRLIQQMIYRSYVHQLVTHKVWFV